MCDEYTESELDRRGFAKAAGAAGLAAMLPGCTLRSGNKGTEAPDATSIREMAGVDVSVTTPDGKCDAYFTHPKGGKHPGVLIWPDIRGLRPAFRQMADRLAGEGYAVLVVNPFYRNIKGLAMAEGEDFADADVRARLFGYRKALTQEAVMRDASAMLPFLDSREAVDTGRQLGVAGYCMGGPLTIFSAAQNPRRVGAGAIFHGSGVSNESEDSPHLLVPKTKAGYLFAIAENDDERDPGEKTRLKAVLAPRKEWHEVEVYPGAMHGWCPPDSRAYNKAAAEKAWGRMLALFRATL